MTTEHDQPTERPVATEPDPPAHAADPEGAPPEPTTSTVPDGPPEQPAPGPQLSKKELKRQLKRQAMLAERPAKRAAERARKKAKKIEAKQALLAAQHPSDHLTSSPLENPDPGHKRQKTSHDAGLNSSQSKQPAQVFPATVLFDCSFDDRMSDKEIVSLDRQLSASYSVNRRASVRFSSLLCSSFNGKLRNRFETNGSQHIRWNSFAFTDCPLSSLIVPDLQASAKQPENVPAEHPASASPEHAASPASASPEHAAHPAPQPTSAAAEPADAGRLPLSPLGPFERSKVVYLTADSPHVLTSIEPSTVYVIGALVDHNRYKNLCLEIAEKTGVRHAQLPISEHMAELKTRKVLTVNQVVEILLNWISERDWRVALERAMPQRKLAPSGHGSAADVTGEEEQEDDRFT